MSKLVLERKRMVSGVRMEQRLAADELKRQSFAEWLEDKSCNHFGSATPLMSNGYGVTL